MESTDGKPPVEQVTTGTVIMKKAPLGQRFKSIFFGGDGRSAVRYIAADVLLPAIRNLVVDATTKGIERMVYGEATQRRRPTGYGYTSRIQYNNPVSRTEVRPARLPDQPPSMRSLRREPHELVLASRDEAELVLERLMDIIETYEIATVADLYQLTGLPASHVDNKWGWTNLKSADVKQVREGYLLDLPVAEEV